MQNFQTLLYPNHFEKKPQSAIQYLLTVCDFSSDPGIHPWRIGFSSDVEIPLRRSNWWQQISFNSNTEKIYGQDTLAHTFHSVPIVYGAEKRFSAFRWSAPRKGHPDFFFLSWWDSIDSVFCLRHMCFDTGTMQEACRAKSSTLLCAPDDETRLIHDVSAERAGPGNRTMKLNRTNVKIMNHNIVALGSIEAFIFGRLRCSWGWMIWLATTTVELTRE